MSKPYSIVQFFQSQVKSLTGTSIDLVHSPKKDLELNKARLILEYCDDDMRLVMKVIKKALDERYILDRPSLALVYGKIEQILYTLKCQDADPKVGSYLDRPSIPDPNAGDYLSRSSDYQDRRVSL